MHPEDSLTQADLGGFDISHIKAVQTGRFKVVDINLEDIADISIGDRDADFWLQRRGSSHNVGTVWRVFSDQACSGRAKAATKYDIGVKFKKGQPFVDPQYFSYVLENMKNSGHWKAYSYGTLTLQHIRVSDVKRIPVAQNCLLITEVDDVDG